MSVRVIGPSSKVLMFGGELRAVVSCKSPANAWRAAMQAIAGILTH
jgi:hypothetical protein